MSFKFVPWFDRNEWLSVKDDVCSGCVTRLKRAVKNLEKWAARVQHLPKAIEGTLHLADVYCRDDSLHDKNEAKGSCTNEKDMKLMYCAVLMRFLNCTLDIQGKVSRTMYEEAASVNIPDWIVQIRHDISHGQTIPSLLLLRMAVEYLLQWLKDTYWLPESVPFTRKIESFTLNDIIDAYNLWNRINEKLFDGCVYVSDITDDIDEEMQRILKLIRNAHYNDSSLECILITELDVILIDLLRKRLRKQCGRHLVDYVLSEDSIFLDENRMLDTAGNFNNAKTERLWLKLALILIDTPCFPYFLKRLISIGNRDQYSSIKQRLASIRAKNFIQLTQMMQTMTTEQQDTPAEAEKFKKRRKSNEAKANCCDIQTQLSTLKCQYSTVNFPVDLTRFRCDLRDILYLALFEPHSYTPIFIEGLFAIQVIPIGKKKQQKLLKLLNIVVSKHTDYNNDDNSICNSVVRTIYSLSDVTQVLQQENIEHEQQSTSVKFIKCTDLEAWKQCPLGVLPRQYSEL